MSQNLAQPLQVGFRGAEPKKIEKREGESRTNRWRGRQRLGRAKKDSASARLESLKLQ